MAGINMSARMAIDNCPFNCLAKKPAIIVPIKAESPSEVALSDPSVALIIEVISFWKKAELTGLKASSKLLWRNIKIIAKIGPIIRVAEK